MRGRTLLLLALGGAGTARAQGVRAEPSATMPVLESVTLGAVGFFGGALIGHGSANGCAGEWCDLGATALGAVVGQSIGVAYGAHLGNRGRGSVGADLAISTGVMALGIALFSGSNDDSGRDYLLISGAQIAATVAMERTTGRANERKRGLRVSVAPMPHGRVGILASVPLP